MAAQMPIEMRDNILHSSLISGELFIMASDLNLQKPVDGNTVHLCVNSTSEEELNTLFSKLSEAGTITEHITDMPWVLSTERLLTNLVSTGYLTFRK